MGRTHSLNWIEESFLLETPGDEEVGGLPRQVNGYVGHVYFLRMFPIRITIVSKEVEDSLKLQRGDEVILGGNQVAEGMDPYAQRYGGHQFGNWANQLGDGRVDNIG